MEPAGPHISVAPPIGALCSSGTGNSKARQRSNSLPAAELTLVLGDLSRHLVSMKPYEIANHMTQLSIRTSQMSSVTLCPGEKSLTTQPNGYVMFASVCVLVACLTFCKTSTSESAKTPFPCSSACQRLFVKGWQIQQYILVLPAFACILLHRSANKQYIGLSTDSSNSHSESFQTQLKSTPNSKWSPQAKSNSPKICLSLSVSSWPLKDLHAWRHLPKSSHHLEPCFCQFDWVHEWLWDLFCPKGLG